MDRGSTSPVHSLGNATSANASRQSYSQSDHSRHDNYMRTGVLKEDPVITASSTASATKESSPPPPPPKDGLYQRPTLLQQTRIEDYKQSPPVIPIDGEENRSNPQAHRPVVRESLSSEPELSSRETRRQKAAPSGELRAPRPPTRSTSAPAVRRRRTSRERDDGSCRLASPPPGLLRPTTFWRNIPRSAVAAPDFSPVIRRSTFVAAGMQVDRPLSGLSALGVEARGPPAPVILPPELI